MSKLSINIPTFDSIEEASAWMYDEKLVNESCIDNYRFAFHDDPIAMEKYDEKSNQGCCGFFDETVCIAGRLAYIGCNYGH